jgi:transcription factor SPT20
MTWWRSSERLEQHSTMVCAHPQVRELKQQVLTRTGCLIVQVHDHRSSSSATSASKVKAKQDPGSIHNYNEWICPSPMVPFPTPKPPEAEKKEEEKDGKVKGPRIFTTVLHPTPLTLHADMAILASTPMPQGRAQSIAQTPTSVTMPRTPSSLTINTAAAIARPKMILDDTNVHEFEAKHLLATSPALILTPAKNAEEAKKLHKALRHPLHCYPFPPPKARKRTMAELQADEAQAAEQERLLLFMDERRYAAHTASGPESAVGDGSGSSFEHSFKKFKVIESLRREAAEKKREIAEKAERDKKARSDHENRARMELRKQQELQKQQMMARNASQQGSPVLPMTRPGSSGNPMSPAMRQQQHHQQQQPQAQAMAMQHSLSQHSQHASSPRPPQAIPHTQPQQQQQQQQHLHPLSQAPLQQQVPARVNYPNQLHRQNLGLAQAQAQAHAQAQAQAAAQAQAQAQAQAAHRASPHPQQMQSPHPQHAQPVVTQVQAQAAAYHQMAAQHNQMLQQFSPEQIRAAAAQHQHQQMLMQQRQIQLGRGGQFVGKNVVGALRGRGGMPPQMQQQQQQQQGFQDFGINIGAGMQQQQQQQQINMMGRGMPMGRGR